MGDKGLVVWQLGEVLESEQREEGVCMGEGLGRGLGMGQQYPGRMKRATARMAIVAMGDYYSRGIDPVINYIEDNGSQVSHCLRGYKYGKGEKLE